MYPFPLELEKEDTTCEGRTCFRFLETWNELTPEGNIRVIHYHKNSHQQRLGKPLVKNMVDFTSHIPYHQKFGRVVGALISAQAHSVGENNRDLAVAVVLQDMQRYGMPRHIASAALNRLHQRMGDILTLQS